RDRIVRELVEALEEARQGGAPAPTDGSGVVAAPADVSSTAPERNENDAERSRGLTEENASLRQKLDVLALDLARREGEAQASAWSVSELERKLADATRAAAPTDDRGGMLDELDALRRALTQEHELRVQLESGEELARARAELQRQATLLGQVG